MTATIIAVAQAGAPETSRPAPGRVVRGDPVFTTWNIEDRGGLYAGVWRSTPGAWRVVCDEWEYFRVISGRSVLTPDGDAPVTLNAGDSYIIRPGFTGTWDVVETTTKDYVIRV